jgi:anti-sigma factor RsiW
MDHREALETMASERYLLGELSPEQRDAYEEHLFDCTECASDAMLGAAFVDRAKAILPTMQTSGAPARSDAPAKDEPAKRDWFAWLRPAIMVPVFASLIGVIAYQNLVTYPALEVAANEPQILPAPTVLHGDTRSALPVVHADLVQGSTVLVEVPESAGYASWKFDFYNSAGKLIWSRTVANSSPAQDTQTIWLPGHIKQDTYKLAVSGVSSTGEVVPVQQHFFDLQVKK